MLKVPTVVGYQRKIVQERRSSYPRIVNLNRMPVASSLIGRFGPLSAQLAVGSENY